MKTEYDGIGICALIDDDGKMYIGSSVNVKQRLIRHRQKMKDGTCNKKMQEALKQGKMFHCEIIEKIEYGNNLWYLWEREQYYIKKYNTIEEVDCWIWNMADNHDIYREINKRLNEVFR